MKYYVRTTSKIYHSGKAGATMTYEQTVEASSPTAALGLVDDVLQDIGEKLNAAVILVESTVAPANQ